MLGRQVDTSTSSKPQWLHRIVMRQKNFSAVLLILPLISHTVTNARELSASNTGAIDAMLSTINKIRANEGLHALVHEETASLAATLHADELVGRKLLSHRNLNGERVAERYRLVGGTGTKAGENLGAGDSIESILIAWVKSPSHRSNLLNPEWYRVGFGQARTDKGRIILVAIFSNSRWKNSSFEINRGIATLKGQFLHPKGIAPPTISIRVGEREIGPVLVRPGARQTTFTFPTPQSWQDGSVAPILLSATESGVTKQVDLLLLKVP